MLRKEGSMGKLYLFYKRHNSAYLGEVLKVKIDDNITAEVKKNTIFELELADGTHNVKMYFQGWGKDELVGYIDKNIEIIGDTYYIYEGPATIVGKGKLNQKNSKSPEAFKKYAEKSNNIYIILGIILFIIGIIIVLIF